MKGEAAASEAPWTIGRLLQWTQQYLSGRGVTEARLATEVLLAHALDCRKIELYTRFESVPGSEPLTAFRDLVKQAAQCVPIAYLVGRKEFFSLDFEVNPAVLIPRPETEALVVRAVKLCAERQWEQPRFLDVGTGSGCVAVAILTQLAAARAVATDISDDALQVARRNAERHGVADRTEFVRADRLDLPQETVPPGGFDFIVSNPPYIVKEERDALPAEVRDHEPAAALFDGGDGLSFYRSFAEGAAALMRTEGSILVEIGYSKGPAVVEIFSSAGGFEHVGTWRDPGDPHDRVMEFRPCRSGL